MEKSVSNRSCCVRECGWLYWSKWKLWYCKYSVWPQFTDFFVFTLLKSSLDQKYSYRECTELLQFAQSVEIYERYQKNWNSIHFCRFRPSFSGIYDQLSTGRNVSFYYLNIINNNNNKKKKKYRRSEKINSQMIIFRFLTKCGYIQIRGILCF